MTSADELFQKQSAMPAERLYYLIMERPVGSYIWTWKAISCDVDAANDRAKEIAVEGVCARIITCELPRMPDSTCYALMADDDTVFVPTK